MPLLEVTQTRHVSASIRLTDTTALQVDQYAAFIHASADEVIEQALAYVFSKDRDFQEFLKSPAGAADYAYVARSSGAGFRCSGAAQWKACSCNRIQRFCAGTEGMNRCQHPRPNHCGALRRKNLDTPSLIGCCLALTGGHWHQAHKRHEHR